MSEHDRQALLERNLKQHASSIARLLSVPDDLKSVTEIEDIMQETFVDAFVAIDQMPDEPSEFRPWLARIAQRNLVDAIRVSRALKRAGTRQLTSSAADVLLGSASRNAPSGQVRRRERSALLGEASRALPTPYRSVAEAMLAEQTPQEIADRLGRSIGTTYVLMGRTRKMLGRVLRKRRTELLDP